MVLAVLCWLIYHRSHIRLRVTSVDTCELIHWPLSLFHCLSDDHSSSLLVALCINITALSLSSLHPPITWTLLVLCARHLELVSLQPHPSSPTLFSQTINPAPHQKPFFSLPLLYSLAGWLDFTSSVCDIQSFSPFTASSGLRCSLPASAPQCFLHTTSGIATGGFLLSCTPHAHTAKFCVIRPRLAHAH